MNLRESTSFSILMLPWLAHGHGSPFLELAKRLSSYSNTIMVHFCSTPINLSSIREAFDDNAFPNVQLVELHLPTIPGLPPHLHSTKNLPSHLMPALKEAFDLAAPSFEHLLDELKPDFLFFDFIQPWAPEAARRRNIPSFQFLTTSAASSAYFVHLLKKPNQDFPFVHNGAHADLGFRNMFNRESNGLSDAERVLRCLDGSCKFIAIRSFREIESKYIDYLTELMGKEMVPVGPLVQENTRKEGCHARNKVIQWLSRKEKRSVVYASFGSEYFMSEEQMEELAHGLELSEVSFIWVVRFPTGEQCSWARPLLTGFRRRVGEDRGFVVEGWAPQREILTHPSVGGFLTHCGWSSVMEGMKFGVPMIALPLQLDQPLNAKLIVELGLGVWIKGKKTRVERFQREEVAKGIRAVMIEEEGECVRRRAEEMADMMARKGNEEVEVLVGKMIALRSSNSKDGN